jgi:hypothetical protein
MARDFIKIDRTTVTATHASLLLDYVRQLRTAYDLGVRVKAVMDHNQDGTSFTDIEVLFGLPTGQGQAVYDLVNGSVGAMDGTFQAADAKNLTERVG